MWTLSKRGKVAACVLLTHQTGVTQGHFTTSLQNGQATETFVNNFRIIGQRRGNNVLVHVVTHLTINANGDVTADHEITSTECR